MLSNFLLSAWRQLLKHKGYALINLSGLVIGLAVYVFGSLLVDYERSHDSVFRNHERIYTAGTVFSPSANVGVAETSGIYTAFAPLILADVPEIEAVARTVSAEFLVSIADNHFYEDIRFTDPALLRIFDFNFLEGDASALDQSDGILLVRSMADKLFGDGPALGKTLLLDHDVNLQVTAVISDVSPHTHFNASIIGEDKLTILAPLAALNTASDYDLAGNFNNLSMGDNTYMLLPPGKGRSWLQTRLDGVFEQHFPDDRRDFIAGVRVRPLSEVQTMIWDAVGLPVLDSIRVLALLVLVIAIVNYTNLATAQSLGRAREVGLRKTMGASRGQLLVQFMTESVFLVTLAMLLAMALLVFAVPMFNAASGRALQLDLVALGPWLVLTTLATGLLAGAYPAYLISRTSPIAALNGGVLQRGGGVFRALMLGLQFAITVFMLAMVLVVYLQNRQVEKAADIYPRSEVLTLQRLDVEPVLARLDTLRNELLAIPGVTHVSYSDQLPYEQSNSSFGAGPKEGDDTLTFLINQVHVDEHFLAAFDIPLLAGRGLDRGVSGDTLSGDAASVNVLVNELALRKLGFPAGDAAIGMQFFDFPDDRATRAYRIVGVFPDQNFQGFHNVVKPTTFIMEPAAYRYASIRVGGAAMSSVLPEVEDTWQQLIPEYPIQTEYLQETFNDVFRIYQGMSAALAGFATLALLLSLIGLFGLSAFMAQSRTREIGIRKVMGASALQLVRFLVWQFSRPVMWSVLVALPLAYLASNVYLNFFAERIQTQELVILAAGVIAILVSWAVVSIHAWQVARTNPVHALRHE